MRKSSRLDARGIQNVASHATTRTLAEALEATEAFTQKAADMVVMADIVTVVCVDV